VVERSGEDGEVEEVRVFKTLAWRHVWIMALDVLRNNGFVYSMGIWEDAWDALYGVWIHDIVKR
jgi:hypothetical protein